MDNPQEIKREKVRVVPIKYIDDFPDHPFKVVDDESMVIEAMKLKEEKELIYSDENEMRELGCIGHLRGDFGRHGSDFYSQWFPHKCHDLKDDKFKIIFDG